MRQSRRRVIAIETGAPSAAISFAFRNARAIRSSGLTISWTSPLANASSAPIILPDIIHSTAFAIPTMRGRNQLEQDSATMARRTKT